MKLYGSLTSPYVRLCRLAAEAAGLAGEVELIRTDPFADEAFRRLNPLGKVPALAARDGTVMAASGVIVRYFDELAGGVLYTSEGLLRHEADAGAALGIGVLDLGVASLLEDRRPEAERSATWQARRREGIEAALPVMAAWGQRVTGDTPGIVTLTYACALDWLSFRLPDVPWRNHDTLAALMDAQAEREAFRATDPRTA